MVGCEFCNFSLKISACSSHSHVFILGLILACCTTLIPQIQAFKAYSYYVPVSCESISSKYKHCVNHSAGVHDLDCFGTNDNHYYKCTWKPGKHLSKNKYTLIIRQLFGNGKESCKTNNTTKVSMDGIELFSNYNVTAEIFENNESNCTKAVFRGVTNSLKRCSAPYNVSFLRHSGKLYVNPTWQQDKDVIENYIVKYKPLNGQSWNESQPNCKNGNRCLVETPNSSQAFNVQIQCVTNDKCSQCEKSKTFTVPSELTAQPEIDTFEDSNTSEENGKRLVFLKWKFPANELHDRYMVTVEKASGENPRESMNTTEPEIRLILSYSDFIVSISAVNNVSTSPAVNVTIPEREDVPRIEDGRLNVIVHSNKSFTVYWKADLVENCVCYSVEWRKKGQKAMNRPFFQNQNNKIISDLTESECLEPYKRYNITLHTRPDKDTCNLKNINNTESTYGRTQFYFIEGTPVSAPTNISSHIVTSNSVMLEWLPIPEDDIRGFLLGYTVHYMEYHEGAEINITLDPELSCFELADLKSDTAYKVQISGFTRAGAGVRSELHIFETNREGYFDSNIKGLISICAVVLFALIFGPTVIKRTKVFVWPSIPNPGNSNAMQKIEKTYELELLESINTLKVEEWDTNSLQIVEKEAVDPANTLPLLHESEDEGETFNWSQSDSEDVTEGFLPEATSDAFSHVPQTDLHTSPFTYSSEYTTMEMFNQLIPQSIPANAGVSQAEESKSQDTDLTVVKPGLDYIRQFSTSPTLDNELSTF